MNDRRVIFISTPLGLHKPFIAEKTERIFKIREDEKRIYFCLGNLSRLDSTDDNWPRIQVTINDHLTRFPETTFIYFGWEVLDYIDKLREEYPYAKYLGCYYMRDGDDKELTISATLAKLYDIERDESIIKNKLDRHYAYLDRLYNEGEPTVKIKHKFCDDKRRCFVIRRI